MTKIYDVEGRERTWNWLRSIYGNVEHLQVRGGDPDFILSEVWAMCDPNAGVEGVPPTLEAKAIPFAQPIKVSSAGPGLSVDPGAVIVVRVEDYDGNPIQGVPLARHWPDNTLPLLPPELATWNNKGITGQTDENGEAGFAMGHGDYYYTPNTQQGASTVWPQAGEALKGIGMIAGTSHWTIWPVFTPRYVDSVEPGIPEDAKARVAEIADRLQLLAGDLMNLAKSLKSSVR